MKIALAATLLAACSFPTPSEEYACRTTDDCASDRVCTQGFCVLGNQPMDGPMTDADLSIDCTTFPARHFDACAIPQPSGDLRLTIAGSYTYDTTTGALLDPGGGSSLPPGGMFTNGRVLSVTSLYVAAGTTMRVTGSAPLIVAAWNTIEVDGTIDAASLGTPTTLGAGANPAGCSTHPAVLGQNGAGAGGGGGGGGGAAGGRGGDGNNGGNNGGVGGTLIAAPLLLGGCPGARGGLGNSTPGDGGDGGGAVQLTARTSISVAATGKVLAGGAGGKPGQNSGSGGGGGGGGAGGMIGFESPTVTVAALGVVAANGGGGGQGAGLSTGTAGQNGQPTAARATGGNGGSGGTGGLGGALAGAIGGGGQQDGSGGGGGGGGTGFIAIKATTPATAGAVISPTATTIP
jgi:hypothetical protein